MKLINQKALRTVIVFYFISVFLLISTALAEEPSTTQRLQSFKTSFADARASFLANIEELKQHNPHLRTHTVQIPTRTSENLQMDVAYIPPLSGKKERLLILTSGVHGMEGFVGSALQNQFTKENFWQLRDANLGILLIHAINPYGFKFNRRVTENNVDLNRNFDTSTDLFTLKNEGYKKVDSLLNPTEVAHGGIWDRLKFYFDCVKAIVKHSMESLRRAILRGQYEFPNGIYFGGTGFEPQKDLIEKEILEVAPGYEQTLLVDLHTGYGRRGQLHLFSDQTPDMDPVYLQNIFAGYELESGQKKDFYAVSGGLVVYLAKLLKSKSKFAGIVFEFGTLDSQKTVGSLDSLYRMVRENQKFHYGAHSKAEDEEINHAFAELFYPESPEWRQAVSQQFQEVLSRALTNLKELK
ncbi:MAG: M14 family metallopeptidase [Bdellovibrio sp.]